MITLITGTPGSGKSVYAVWHEIKTAIEKGRNVYSCGIPKLSLPAIPLKDEEARLWYKTAPKIDPDDPDEIVKLSTIEEGSLIVIDEVQRLWRPTGAGQVSPDIAALEIHRHHGLDFVVITQHPSLLHRNVRALVGKHIHLRATALGNYLYEFPEWCENPQTKSARQSCVRSRYRLPKAAFALYESASLHVKTSKRLPIQYFIFFAILLGVPIGGYLFVKNMYDRTHVIEQSPDPLMPSHVSKPSVSAVPPGQTVSVDDKPAFLNVAMVTPQIDWSKVAACVSNKDVCRCYGDVAERLAVPDRACRDAIEFGWSGRKAAPSVIELKEAKQTTRNEEDAKPSSLKKSAVEKPEFSFNPRI